MATVLEPTAPAAGADEALYEIIDGRYVELLPMGAFQTVMATVLVEFLAPFVRQHRLGTVAGEHLFVLREDPPLHGAGRTSPSSRRGGHLRGCRRRTTPLGGRARPRRRGRQPDRPRRRLARQDPRVLRGRRRGRLGRLPQRTGRTYLRCRSTESASSFGTTPSTAACCPASGSLWRASSRTRGQPTSTVNPFKSHSSSDMRAARPARRRCTRRRRSAGGGCSRPRGSRA